MKKIKFEVTKETKRVGLAAAIGAAIGSVGYVAYNFAKGFFNKDEEDIDEEGLDEEDIDDDDEEL